MVQEEPQLPQLPLRPQSTKHHQIVIRTSGEGEEIGIELMDHKLPCRVGLAKYLTKPLEW